MNHEKIMYNFTVNSLDSEALITVKLTAYSYIYCDVTNDETRGLGVIVLIFIDNIYERCS